MNLTRILTGSFLLIVCLVHAQVYQVSEESTLQIAGTSNMHDWVTDVTVIEGTAEFQTEADGKLNILSATLTMPATSIKSEKGKRMDKLTYEALKTDQYETISFELTSADVMTKDEMTTATVTGNLTVSGTTQTVTFDATSSTDNTWTGSVPLKMTDFGIDPPTALLGALKTGDEIQIDFNLVFK